MKKPWKKKDKSWERAIERANNGNDDHAAGGPQSVSTLLNAVCVEPTEIRSFRAIVDEGRVVSTQPNDPQVGIVLTLALSRVIASAGVIIPIDLPVGISREGVVAVHDALGKWLADGGHYHWYAGEQVERMQDVDLNEDTSDVSINVPDNLDGLT